LQSIKDLENWSTCGKIKVPLQGRHWRVKWKRGVGLVLWFFAGCYIYRKYLSADGETVYKLTSFQCTVCKMPLCKKNWLDARIGWYRSYLDEHLQEADRDLGCHDQYLARIVYPESKQVNLHPRRSTRARLHAS
jgi:hypothetical protein